MTARAGRVPAAGDPAALAGRPGDLPSRLQPGDRGRQPAGTAAGHPRGGRRRGGRGDPRPALRGSPGVRARRGERTAHGPDARGRHGRRRAVGHDRAPRARLPRAAAAADGPGASGPASPRTPGRKTLVRAASRWPSAPGQALVEARGVFVVPRSDRLEAYFGAITDATGRPQPARPAHRRHRPRAGLSRWPTTSRWPRPPPARRPTCCSRLRGRELTGRALGDAGDAAAQQRDPRRARPRAAPGRRLQRGGGRRPRAVSRPSRVWIVDPLDGTREYGEAGPARLGGARGAVVGRRGGGWGPDAAAVALPALGEVLVTEPRPARPARAGWAGADRRQPHPSPGRRLRRRRGAGRRARAAGLGRLQDGGGGARERSTPTCTPAACTSGTPPRRSPSPGRPA